ncbi:hypothetical protein G5B31_08175 [Rhodobacter sp. SGA-6-6]|uniref:phage holin family protein n=1 Tax=Rhodobacter sp. SGA-6-6 TaxID=2710882 RepID=UPI0013EC9EF0|nr:phage holin family protein [Rhodobacter sp. SGA-6-6]NGM45511.1 hypothetical protein [Rhodobacter sp. SGA-6-6]
MSDPRSQSLWPLLRFALSARQSLRLRLALMKAETRERGRFAGQGLVLAVLGAILAVAAIGLGLAAVVAALCAAGWSVPAALGLTAGGSAVVGLILLLLGRQALARAFSSRR